ncbi:MAG TPA: DUF5915 domain-containing protein, partial [Patescibacteria group bacterium]|nr:DUF5915 domain-containing protein [Patescibacteria group bacterium]
YIATGLALRAEAKVKVRQPLASVTVPSVSHHYLDVIAEELNVKEVKIVETDGQRQQRIAKPAGEGAVDALKLYPEVKLDTTLTPELKREGVMREVVRNVQSARKQAGLQVDDRISLVLHGEDTELNKTIEEHASTIQAETLATSLNQSEAKDFETQVKVEGVDLTIRLAKA